jgi:hypothetical protein
MHLQSTRARTHIIINIIIIVLPGGGIQNVVYYIVLEYLAEELMPLNHSIDPLLLPFLSFFAIFAFASAFNKSIFFSKCCSL